jgi:hypothetical protein
MKIKTWFVVGLTLIGLSLPAAALARKKLPARARAVTQTASSLPRTNLVLRGDKLALLVQLTNLTEAASVSYVLTYNSTDAPQGVEGTLDPAIGSAQKELVFGTCSGTVCTYHTGISDMKFEVKLGLKSGKTLIRKYTIKI